MNSERMMKVLLSPVISEKSTLAADAANQFVFKVATDATKPEIKQAVEKLFNVKVAAVQISNMKGKQKTTRYVAGRRKNWKKAYVRLESGHDISFVGAE
jgi:large subunit ribosomal protein L23